MCKGRRKWLAPLPRELGDLAGPQVTALLLLYPVPPRPWKSAVQRAGAGSNLEMWMVRKEVLLSRERRLGPQSVWKQPCPRGNRMLTRVSQEIRNVLASRDSRSGVCGCDYGHGAFLAIYYSFLHPLSVDHRTWSHSGIRDLLHPETVFQTGSWPSCKTYW